MKKSILLIGVCVLLLGMSTASSLSIQNIRNLKSVMPLSIISSNNDDVPSWAEGTFNGTWGIREYSIFFRKLINIELGTVSGYYKERTFSFFAGTFVPHWNESCITDINGIYFGPFLVGELGDLTVEDDDYEGSCNETVYVGIGNHNETDFNWRLMGQDGPTFYMKGTFTKFE